MQTLQEVATLFYRTTELPVSVYDSALGLLCAAGLPEIPPEYPGVTEQIKNWLHELDQEPVPYLARVTPLKEHFLLLQLSSGLRQIENPDSAISYGPMHLSKTIGPSNQIDSSTSGRNKEKLLYLCIGPYTHTAYDRVNMQYFAHMKRIRLGTIPDYIKLVEILFQSATPLFLDKTRPLSESGDIEKNRIEYSEIDFYHHHYFLEKQIMKDMLLPEDAVYQYNTNHSNHSNNLNNVINSKRLNSLNKPGISTRNKLWDKSGSLRAHAGTIATDSNRNAKNLSIIAIGLMERNFIEAGLDAHTSFTIGDAFLRKIEATSNLTEVDLYLEDAVRHMNRALKQMQSRKYSKAVNRTLRFIGYHLTTKFTLEDAARDVDLNPKYLSKIFHQEVGQPFGEYVCSKRIEEARQMLDFSELSLTEISDMLVFSSKSYFSKCFLKCTGMTPTAYANRVRSLTTNINIDSNI